jgi:hypothetical protein
MKLTTAIIAGSIIIAIGLPCFIQVINYEQRTSKTKSHQIVRKI